MLEHLQESIGISPGLNDVPALLHSLSGLATEVASAGRIRDSSTVAGAVETFGWRTGQLMTDIAVRQLHAQILVQRGRTMPIEDPVAEVMAGHA